MAAVTPANDTTGAALEAPPPPRCLRPPAGGHRYVFGLGSFSYLAADGVISAGTLVPFDAFRRGVVRRLAAPPADDRPTTPTLIANCILAWAYTEYLATMTACTAWYTNRAIDGRPTQAWRGAYLHCRVDEDGDDAAQTGSSARRIRILEVGSGEMKYYDGARAGDPPLVAAYDLKALRDRLRDAPSADAYSAVLLAEAERLFGAATVAAAAAAGDLYAYATGAHRQLAAEGGHPVAETPPPPPHSGSLATTTSAVVVVVSAAVEAYFEYRAVADALLQSATLSTTDGIAFAGTLGYGRGSTQGILLASDDTELIHNDMGCGTVPDAVLDDVTAAITDGTPAAVESALNRAAAAIVPTVRRVPFSSSYSSSSTAEKSPARVGDE